MTAKTLEMQACSEAARRAHLIQELPILVILPHSRCNCRCLMCDIWRIRQIREITAADLEPHLASLRKLKVRWVVFSGGEPLMHSYWCWYHPPEVRWQDPAESRAGDRC